ncbi:DNA starvation/stationary phase protection protein [Proteiniclasticum sp. QWL-01]|uniref:Dps family protein n=1 Tax=Proteiniclasticum sp. QWL-01 TaxID=3036945 RepID=UPI0021FE0C15|nr:DNA starvation/stationary phase protection protein [Proteiniclasticum sp. QWL-01]UUM11890.1 DNA starvation/stationary phase protection protein [Clostridiaceae bacterium HFYG-1003]WFF73381.1 DNA starvation/stationary phase protection protein [Proteiniclasticum sp. QWL-01]
MRKTYLANLMVGNVMLHNLHWNVEGKAFKQIHEYLEFLYDDAFAKYDEVAERMKMDGKMPTASIKEYMADTDMKELEVRAYSIEEALKEAKNYLEHMRELALKIRSEADEKDEFAWVNLMEDHVAGYDKQIWFMNQSLV